MSKNKRCEIIIANPPWYYNENGIMRFGIRSGSRWPFTVDYEKDYLIRYRPFPFWLAYANSLLINNSIDSIFVDSITQGDTYKQFYDFVFSVRPNFVFFEATTPSIKSDLEMIKVLSKNGIKVLLGGAHATVFADELINVDGVYAVFKGAYEKNLLNFFKKEDGGVYEYCDYDIDELPFPYRDDKIIWLYRERTHGYTPFQISILTSRGCPFNCIFCQWPKVMYNKKVKFRSIESIADEVEYLVNKYGNEIFVYIDDDTFNLDENRTIKISEIFARFNLKWSAMCRIDTIKTETWKILLDNGLRYVNIGIESASQKVLNIINKKLDIAKAEETLNYINSIGIKVHLTFTWGAPGESEEDVLLTKQFFDRVNVYSKQQSRCTPLPGTIWWDSLHDKDIDYDGYKSLIVRPL